MKILNYPKNVWRVIRVSVKHFFACEGIFMSSALSFDLLVYSVPLFLIGVSILNYLHGSNLPWIESYDFIFQSIIPDDAKAMSEIFTSDKYKKVGIHPLNLLVMILVSTSLFTTVRVIIRRLFHVAVPDRGFKQRMRDMGSFFILGLLFGVFVLASFTTKFFFSYLKQVSMLHFLIKPSILIASTILRFALVWCAFGFMYGYYGQHALDRKSIIRGAFLTAAMFESSKYILEIYVKYQVISKSHYGALSGLIVYFLWLFYSAIAFVFGTSVAWALGQISRHHHESAVKAQ